MAYQFPLITSSNCSTHPLDVLVTLEAFVPCPIVDVLDFLAAEDVLPKVLTGFGMVPAVAYTSDVSGPWNQQCSHRIVHLVVGSTANEAVTHYDKPGYFAYRASNRSFALKYLIKEARGQLLFSATTCGTQVKWTYTFGVKNKLTKLPLRLYVLTQWKGYMDACLKNTVKHFTT
jgi:hypothetical protein